MAKQTSEMNGDLPQGLHHVSATWTWYVLFSCKKWPGGTPSVNQCLNNTCEDQSVLVKPFLTAWLTTQVIATLGHQADCVSFHYEFTFELLEGPIAWGDHVYGALWNCHGRARTNTLMPSYPLRRDMRDQKFRDELPAPSSILQISRWPVSQHPGFYQHMQGFINTC